MMFLIGRLTVPPSSRRPVAFSANPESQRLTPALNCGIDNISADPRQSVPAAEGSAGNSFYTIGTYPEMTNG